MPKFSASVDIGGTFTDIIFQEDDNVTGFFKVPTTPGSPEVGAVNGISENFGKEELTDLVHATTIATNALLGQHGLRIPKVALLMTRGFVDIIEIGRQNRPKLYDLTFQRPKSLVPRNLRFEVEERTNTHGKVLKGVQENQLHEIASKLRERSVESVAISFLNSYINPRNELNAKSCLERIFPCLSISSEIAPEQREYERTSTTVVNAALIPIISSYIQELEKAMRNFGSPNISVMASSGGLVATEEVYKKPVQIVESGPAAGVIAAAEFAKILDLKNVISFDMGGTTAKAGTVVNGEVSITTEYEVGGDSHHGRVTKGSGYPVRFPFVDLAEVSAGGGTIIWRDSAGGLQIGPVSAGADPGPICYGKGGLEPTVTDANAVIGILGQSLLGGLMKLNIEGALDGFAKLGDPYEVAELALNLADLEMSRAIRMVTVERGFDPSTFTMIAFGGAGPQHAARIAEELGITKVIVPSRAGLFSALGLLYSDWKYEARSSFPIDPSKEFEILEKKLSTAHKSARFRRYADCRYLGQGSELTVETEEGSREEIEEKFRNIHKSTFGFLLNRKIEIVTIRVFGIVARKKPVLENRRREDLKINSREVVIEGKKLSIRVYNRPGLKADTPTKGACIIDDYDSTTFVPDGWTCIPGSMGELTLKRSNPI